MKAAKAVSVSECTVAPAGKPKSKSDSIHFFCLTNRLWHGCFTLWLRIGRLVGGGVSYQQRLIPLLQKAEAGAHPHRTHWYDSSGYLGLFERAVPLALGQDLLRGCLCWQWRCFTSAVFAIFVLQALTDAISLLEYLHAVPIVR
jgi:hypothetical protein